MKITCDREKLLQAFSTVAPVVPSRTTKPILQNVKLEVTKDSATLLATDSEIAVRAELEDFKVEKPGSAILPTTRFGAVIRESSDDELVLETDDRGTSIQGSQSKYRLPGEDPQEFPTIAAFTESSYHALPEGLLRKMIRRTVFATDEDSTRYALGGIMFEFTNDKLNMVGTDGRRMAAIEGSAEAVDGHSTGEDTTTVVPTRAMKVIERSLTDSEEECHLAVRGSDVLLRSKKATIYCRLLEGRFPRWKQVFPKKPISAKVDLVVGPFFQRVRQAMIMTAEETRGVHFKFADGQLHLSAEGSQLGEFQGDLPISYDADPLTIKLDPRFLSDFLSVLEPDSTIQAELRDEDTAIVFNADGNYRYVIMPLSIEA